MQRAPLTAAKSLARILGPPLKITSSSKRVVTKSPHLSHFTFETNAEIEVIVLRNIGGRTIPALEHILVLDSFVHVSDIIVVHHTGIRRLVYILIISDY